MQRSQIRSQASHVDAAMHALGTANAALLSITGASLSIDEQGGRGEIGTWIVPFLTSGKAGPIVSDRYRPDDAFAAALESHGIAFFAAVRVSGSQDRYLCGFDAERRVLTPAQLYVLQTLASAIAEQRELSDLRTQQTATMQRHASRDERLRLLESVVVNANDAVLITEAEPTAEPGPRIRYANAAFTRATGYTLDEIIGKTPRILQGPETSEAARAKLRKALRAWRPVEVEFVNYRKDGTPFDVELSIVPVADETGWYTHWVSVQRDVTDRKIAEEQKIRARVVEAQNEALVHQAFHDDLTALRNRAYFMDRLEVTVARAQASKISRGAVLFFDLDRFKVINDSLGHNTGDLLLIELSRRLSSCIRSQDLLARMGGDEFTVLVEDVTEIQDVLAVADRILAALKEPVRLAGQEVFVYASIGIAYVDQRYTRAEDVLRDADSAMYRAKHDGGMRYAFFDESMYASAVRSLSVQMDLRRAVERKEFAVYYEPIVDVVTQAIVGLEGLVRWNHPERGLVGPADFVDVAEDTGLITAIGSFVLEQACCDMRRWYEKHPGLHININVSSRQIYDQAFFTNLQKTLIESRLPAAALQLEITESVFIDRADYVGSLLTAIRGLGVRIALDDFGTGYSSLSYLERFKLDTLKIDKSFTQRMSSSKIGFAIVHAIVQLARALDMAVIGEGVETAAQLEGLRECRCDFAQGYLFSRPVPASDVPALLDLAIDTSAGATA